MNRFHLIWELLLSDHVLFHFSALMYLNGDFDGGEFFFAHNNKSEQVNIDPYCFNKNVKAVSIYQAPRL